MQRNDFICRVAIFPKFLNNDVFDDEQFLNFASGNEEKTVYVSSVVSKFIMKDEKSIHAFGQSVAGVANNRLKERLGNEIPAAKVNHYLGFYDLRHCDVVAVQMSYYSVQVNWRPENDCEAHFQIEMWQNSRAGNKGEKRRDRTAATFQLAKSLVGPCCPGAQHSDNSKKLRSLLPVKALAA